MALTCARYQRMISHTPAESGRTPSLSHFFHIMRAKPLLTTLAIAISIPLSLSAQEEAEPATPLLKIDAPTDSETDREKVQLTESVTPAFPDPSLKKAPMPTGAEPVEQNSRIPKSVQAMSDDEKQKLAGLMRDASTYLGGIRIQEAFEKLVEAEAMAPDYATIHNLLGAAHTKTRNFDMAAAAFERAVELDPKAFMSRFNLTEIHFVQGKFAEAEKAFNTLLTDNPESPEATRALIEFKILICRLKLDDEAAAREILDTYDFLDDHPGFYFGNAAIHFNKGEDDDARSWIASANRVYPQYQNNIYIDSFIEIGWIENLQ